MSVSHKAYLVVGITISEIEKKSTVPKFDEDSGIKYEKEITKKVWVISGTDIEIRFDEDGELEEEVYDIELSYDHYSFDYKRLGIRLADTPSNCGSTVVDLDNLSEQKDIIVKYIKEEYDLDVVPEVYLIQYCG